MGTYRIYPSKSNSILEDSPTINTGLNEVSELWYGLDGISRHLIKFSFSGYNEQYGLGNVPHISGTTATFKLFPCYPTYELDNDSDVEVADSFDLEIVVMDRDWDEGVGHDFIGLNKTVGFSCWNSASTLVEWTTPGGDYSDQVFSGHVNYANEVISLDSAPGDVFWDTVTGTNNGYMVKFTDDFEALTTSLKSVAKFYTEKTNTYSLPYIELEWTNEAGPSGSTTLSGNTDFAVQIPMLKDSYQTNVVTNIPIKVYRYYTSTNLVADNLEYKVVLLDGDNHFVMQDWQDVLWTATENYIQLDTNWFHSDNEYEILFRYVVDGVSIDSIKEKFRFKVVED